MTATTRHRGAAAGKSPTTLRLTRRGRVVFGSLVVLFVIAVLVFIAVFSASRAQASTQTAEPTVFEYVVAEPGDSLWTLAERIAPGSDPRDVIYDIKRLNRLDGSDLTIGQELAIPRAYTH